MKLSTLKQIILDGLRGLKMTYFSSNRDKYGYIDKSAIVYQPGMGAKQNVFLYKNTIIHEYHKFITHHGKFVMKENSIAATGLTVITSSHGIYNIGDYPGGQGWSDLKSSDVIVEEEVWLGANVTLCPGTHIQRGVVVATGSVCLKSKEYPPYCIIGGSPAQFIKFKFTLEQQIEHEKIRFIEDNRIPSSVLEENYVRFLKTQSN
jgi:acetyltransferase-like isoleucine patch superfamily enzyme